MSARVASRSWLPLAIDSIVLEGDAAGKFQWALTAANQASAGREDSAIDHCLGARAIELVMRRVQNAILARGHVTTRVLVAPQDLKRGTLTLSLIPGRIRAIRMLPGSDPRIALRNAVPAAPSDLLDLRDVEQALENFKRDGTSRFVVVTADANISAPFALAGQQLRYAGAWRFQSNRTPLLTQDRFAIGGRYTVRGFDGASSLLAERGWMLRNEIGMPFGATGQELYVGLDHGEVGGPSSKDLLGTRLTGAVLRVRGQLWDVQYEIFAGVPVRKPEFFNTAGCTAGFSFNRNF